jgi:hypothetical protein
MVHLWWKKAGHLCTCIVSEAGMQQLSRQVQCHPHCDALTLLHLPLGEHGAFLTRAEGCCSSADALSQRSKPSQCRSSPISSVLARAKHILQVGNQRGQGDIHVHALTAAGRMLASQAWQCCACSPGRMARSGAHLDLLLHLILVRR